MNPRSQFQNTILYQGKTKNKKTQGTLEKKLTEEPEQREYKGPTAASTQPQPRGNKYSENE